MIFRCKQMDKLFACVIFIINIWTIECIVCSKDSCDKNVTCPNNKPFTVCGKPVNGSCRYICVSSCQKDQVLDGSKCIDVTECNKEIVFQRQCLHLCPVGYVFMYDGDYNIHQHTTADLTRQPCVCSEYLKLNVFGFAMATVAYILFLIAFFSMKSFSLYSMKKYCRSFCNCKKKKDKLKSDDNDSDEERINQARNCADDDDDVNMLL